jgi:LCP family protein required for cell wall assembly
MLKHVLFFLILLGLTVTAYGQSGDPEDPQEDDFGLRPLAWDGQAPINILILGVDRRPDEGNTRLTRTDVIIIASIDPTDQTISLLHIPRDVFMSSPNTDSFSRVNTLYQAGENLQQGYGPYWVADTLQMNLGIFIERYILFDFDAFIALIDAIGGVEITLGYPIYDATFPDMNYDYDPFYLSAGTHQLDGYDALRFVRTRHQDTDGLRGERQMQLMQAVYAQLATGDTFLDLIAQAPTLAQSLDGDIYTDLNIEDSIRLARYVLLVPPENVVTGSLSDEYTIQTITRTDGNIKIPDTNRIAELMIAVFGENY